MLSDVIEEFGRPPALQEKVPEGLIEDNVSETEFKHGLEKQEDFPPVEQLASLKIKNKRSFKKSFKKRDL